MHWQHPLVDAVATFCMVGRLRFRGRPRHRPKPAPRHANRFRRSHCAASHDAWRGGRLRCLCGSPGPACTPIGPIPDRDSISPPASRARRCDLRRRASGRPDRAECSLACAVGLNEVGTVTTLAFNLTAPCDGFFATSVMVHSGSCFSEGKQDRKWATCSHRSYRRRHAPRTDPQPWGRYREQLLPVSTVPILNVTWRP